MKILLNGTPCEIADDASVAALLAATDYAERRVAVEVNREIVPKSQRGERTLRPGDRVEIVQAMGGG